MIRTDGRKNNGGPRAGAGRKPDAIKKKYRKFLLSDEQYAMAKKLGGSPWLQGVLNLKIKAEEAENLSYNPKKPARTRSPDAPITG